jgi:hypothetical protein
MHDANNFRGAPGLFRRGGYSASIGDGQLHHPGRGERIVEIYCMLTIYFWMLLYQCMAIRRP